MPEDNHLQGRLVSLDVFRGISIALMIIVNNPWYTAYPVLQHAAWNGLTLADVVFPAFIFIVGVSIAFSFSKKSKRGLSTGKVVFSIIRRTIILFLLGLFVNGFPYYDPNTLRITGVLQRIAVCYFVCSLVFLFMKNRERIILTLAVPLVCWGLVSLSLPNIDVLLLGSSHVYAYTAIDPEGIISTFSAIGTCLIGVLVGQYILEKGHTNALRGSVKYGLLALVIGLFWNLVFPVNKMIWSSSYVALTGGLNILVLTACLYIIDVRNKKWWTTPFVILGMNAIFVYVFSEIVSLALIHFSNIQPLIYGWYSSFVSPENASLFYAITFLGFCWIIPTMLYRKRIFLKV
jgi:predicted acyltransferase